MVTHLNISTSWYHWSYVVTSYDVFMFNIGFSFKLQFIGTINVKTVTTSYDYQITLRHLLTIKHSRTVTI